MTNYEELKRDHRDITSRLVVALETEGTLKYVDSIYKDIPTGIEDFEAWAHKKIIE